MQTYKIKFTFTGSLADEKRLDGSDAVTYTQAARQLLALHAHFYTTAMVPNGGALNQTKLYRVYKEAPVAGSYDDPWLIAIVAGAIGSGMGPFVTAAVTYTYEQLLKDNIGAIIGRKPSSMPLEMRREPVFTAQDTRNEPVFDIEPEREHHWRQLRERSADILVNVARPVGRCATKLVISGEATRIATIDVDARRQLLQAQITVAMHDAKLRRQQEQPGALSHTLR
jgi:hypothetical protein